MFCMKYRFLNLAPPRISGFEGPISRRLLISTAHPAESPMVRSPPSVGGPTLATDADDSGLDSDTRAPEGPKTTVGRLDVSKNRRCAAEGEWDVPCLR